jgi:hypothetical protein
MVAKRVAYMVFAWAAATGCVVDVEGWSTPEPSPVGRFGVVAQPRLGTVVEGPTASASITFAGVHAAPGYAISIQVLDQDWTTIATATTDSQPSSTDASVYEWQVLAAPAQLRPSRWPQGGLLRVRAVGADGETLAGLFHDSDACLDEHETWVDRAESCGATLDSGIVIVSPADLANSDARPRFLDRTGWIDPLETAQYYETINAPLTVADFRTRFGIAADSPAAIYFNGADLGIGREMRCAPQADGGVACAVANYGEFGGVQREALDAAVDTRGSFATVAMVYTPPLTAPNSVQFMVYGASGALINEAQLDTVGDNLAVPNNCLNCHGTAARYDAATNQVTGASFLPFDPSALVYSTRAGFTEREQAPLVAQLNAAITPATSRANRDLIAGWYPNGAGAPAESFIPLGWTASPLERKVYEHVIAVNCRNCHAAREDDMSFSTAALFKARGAMITRSLCEVRDMPNAQVPLQHMWSGPSRAYLAAFLEIEACNP